MDVYYPHAWCQQMAEESNRSPRTAGKMVRSHPGTESSAKVAEVTTELSWQPLVTR